MRHNTTSSWLEGSINRGTAFEASPWMHKVKVRQTLQGNPNKRYMQDTPRKRKEITSPGRGHRETLKTNVTKKVMSDIAHTKSSGTTKL